MAQISIGATKLLLGRKFIAEAMHKSLSFFVSIDGKWFL